MRQAAKWLGLVALATVMVPFAENPGFFEETGVLMSPALAQSAADRKAEADRLLEQGAEQYRVSQFQEALQSWEQALVIAREIGDLVMEWRTLGNLGYGYDNLGQYQQAINFLEQRLAIAHETGDRTLKGMALVHLGRVYNNLGEYQQAISFFEQSLAIVREIDGGAGISDFRFPPSISQQVLIVTYGQIDNQALKMNSLWGLGITYANLGQYQQAIDRFEQVLTITHEIGDRSGEVSILQELGIAYDALGQYEQAIAYFEQQLIIARDIGDRQSEGNALEHLGVSYRKLGQHKQAIDLFEQQLLIAHEMSDRASESQVLEHLGYAYQSLGYYQQALIFFEEKLSTAQEIDDQNSEGQALENLGYLYFDLGQYQEALNLFDRQLSIAQIIGNRELEGSALGYLGIVYRILGQHNQAIDLFRKQLAINQEIGARDEESKALINLGNVYLTLGQYQEAISFYEQGLAISREISSRPGEAHALANLGLAYAGLEQPYQALEFFTLSLIIDRELGFRDSEAKGLVNQGAMLNLLSQYSRAELAFKQAIEIYESFRVDLPDNQLISLADTQQNAYQSLERALTAQNKTAEALAMTERGRARAFVLQLASRLAEPEEQAAIADSPIADAPTLEEIQQIARDTNSTLVTYSQISDPALYIWVVQPSGDFAFRSVEFEGSGDAGLAINPISAIDGPVYRSAPDESELGQLVADSRATILVESTNTRPEQLRELHTLLIDPIADLRPADPEAKVVFVPQGNLFLVPFAALQDADGTYLIEKHTILTAPSIQVYGLANEAASTTAGANGGSPLSTNNALIVGNPTMPKVWSPTASGDFAETQLTDLPGAKAEAEAIGGFLNITPLVGSQATEARVKQLLPSARLIHLATHGLLDYGDPRAYGTLDFPGAIALAPSDREDGLLTSAEILEMDLQAELAVLSACDTGRGRITGDGVVGLSRSLITAGVPSVVVSLWAVPDAPTAELMTEFYRQLNQGQDKAQALRQAMLTTLEQHPNPRNWAAFTLIGAAE